jgi:hypothetical protein
MRNHSLVQGPRSLAAVVTALAVAALAVLLTAASPSAAGATPTLRAAAKARTVAPGGSLSIDYVVKPAPATLVLRLDRGPRRTVRVAKGRGQVAFAVPAATAPGAHRLTVCAKTTCRSLPVTVSAATAKKGPGQSTGPAGPAPTPSPGPTLPATPPPPLPGPGPAPGAIDFTLPPDPLDVDAQTDAGRRTSATIDVDGGTLETVGADGTLYRLTVPAGALLSPERISMTPIEAVAGMPFSGGLKAGVQLEPSGLRFADYVTVEIIGHPAVAPQRETGFLYQRDGDELQLYPLEESPGRTTFRIIHFSGVGIADGTEAERNAQLLRRTRDVEGQFGAQIATYFRPGEGIDYAGLKATLRAYHDQVLKPLLDAAATDDGLAIQAINRYIPWARMLSLLFADEDEFMVAERQAAQEQWVRVTKNALTRAYQRCIDQNQPEELPAIISWWRQLALLSDEPALPADALNRCARFELDFHTQIAQKHLGNVEGPEVWKSEAIAENLIIELDPISLMPRGSTAAEYVDFRVDIPPHKSGTGCWYGGGEWETVFPLTVSRLTIDLNAHQHSDGTYGYPPLERGKIAVSIVPFLVHELHLTVDCGNSTGSAAWGAFLSSTFVALHDEDQLDDFGGIVFTDWTGPSGGGTMLGAKTYFRTVFLGAEETREDTTLELYHAPIG